MPANEKIETLFNEEIQACIVHMPTYITQNSLKQWHGEFLKLLQKVALNRKVMLLLDSNTHNFESIAAIKHLRDILTDKDKVSGRIPKVAFVQPENYRPPEIISPSEGYFSRYEDAFSWLKLPSQTSLEPTA